MKVDGLLWVIMFGVSIGYLSLPEGLNSVYDINIQVLFKSLKLSRILQLTITRDLPQCEHGSMPSQMSRVMMSSGAVSMLWVSAGCVRNAWKNTALKL